MPKVPSGNEHFHLMSEEIFLRSLIEESGHFRKQANPGNSPMMALMFWHSMIALVNHILRTRLFFIARFEKSNCDFAELRLNGLFRNGFLSGYFGQM